MGAGASTRRAERDRTGPPKTLVSKLDGGTRAFDLMKLMDQDKVEAARESKRRAVLEELERAQASAMVQLTTRHVAEVDELVARHKVRVDALYEEVSGLITPAEMHLAGPAYHANERAQKLLWRSQRNPASSDRTPPPPRSAVTGRLPQSRQQLKLAELGLIIASLPPGRAAGMQSGLRALSALDAVHAKELEELEVKQRQEIAAAQMHARYERTAALYKVDYVAMIEREDSEESMKDSEEDVDDELARLTDEISREGTAISDVDQEGRPFCEMNRAWSEIEDANLSKWGQSASPPAQRGTSMISTRSCRPAGCCWGTANAEDNQVESLVVRSMAVEGVRTYLEPELPDGVTWGDMETFLMEENDAPDVEAATADATKYTQYLCARMLDKQLALQDVA
jgi:hypothetical protein